MATEQYLALSFIWAPVARGTGGCDPYSKICSALSLSLYPVHVVARTNICADFMVNATRNHLVIPVVDAVQNPIHSAPTDLQRPNHALQMGNQHLLAENHGSGPPKCGDHQVIPFIWCWVSLQKPSSKTLRFQAARQMQPSQQLLRPFVRYCVRGQLSTLEK